MAHGEGGGGGGGALREILAVFGFEVETKDLEHGENKLDDFLEKVKHVGHALLGAFAVHELYEFAEANVHAMTAIEHSAAQIGLSTDKIQAWQYAARAAGFEAGKFLGAMSRLQVAQAGAAKGTGKASEAFSSIGVSVKDSSGKMKDADQLFIDIAEGIHKVEDPAKRAATVTKLFGRSGRELLPFLEKGKHGIGELLAKYRELGGGYTKDAIEKAEEFEEAQAGLNLVWTRTKSIISAALLPVLSKLSEWVTHAIKWFNDLAKNSKLLQAALVVLGAAGLAFAIHMAIAFAPIIAAAAGILFLIGVIDDLMVLFSGGHSLIGDWIDKAFGKGQSADIVKELKYFWHLVVEEVKSLVGYIDKVIDAYHKLQDLSGKAGDWLAKKLEVGGADLAYSVAHPTARSTGEGVARAILPSHLAPGGNVPALPQIPGSGGESSFEIVVNAAPGMDEKKLAEHVGEQVDKRLKHHRRAAKSTLPVSGQ